MPPNTHRRKRMHLPNFSYSGGSHVYFLTVCTHDKEPYFAESAGADIIVDEIEHRRKAGQAKVFSCCIMPDHVHLLMSLSEEYPKDLRVWVSAFKRHTTRAYREVFGPLPLWQKNFYDHVVRKEESLFTIAEYILNNPVRKGLAGSWQKYPYSLLLDPLPL